MKHFVRATNLGLATDITAVLAKSILDVIPTTPVSLSRVSIIPIHRPMAEMFKIFSGQYLNRWIGKIIVFEKPSQLMSIKPTFYLHRPSGFPGKFGINPLKAGLR
jgi:hypothetical protein